MLEDQTILLNVPEYEYQDFMLYEVQKESADDVQVELNWLKLESYATNSKKKPSPIRLGGSIPRLITIPRKNTFLEIKK